MQIDLQALASAVEAVELRMPSTHPAGKAHVIAACYELITGQVRRDPAAAGDLLALIAGAVLASVKTPAAAAAHLRQLAPEKEPEERRAFPIKKNATCR